MKFSESQRLFLAAQPQSDLIDRVLQCWPCEVQVNLVDAGEPIEKDGRIVGRRIDGHDCYAKRYPKDAATAPDWAEQFIDWPFDVGAQGVGATGWTQAGSRWVGFDFDGIAGHGEGISNDELARVREAATGLPYIEVRRSTSGTGLHLYVMLADIATRNHTEHAAVAHAVLAKMSTDAGFDFKGSVDCYGAVLWFWSRRATAENRGLTLIKAATQTLAESDIPDWRRFLKPAASVSAPIEQDEDHKRILDACRKHGPTSYDGDHGCYRLHTAAAKLTHSELGLKGAFETVSEGTDLGTPNAFAFLRPHGVLYVERYGTDREHPLWDCAKSGHACILLNSPARPEAVCRAVGAVWTGDGFTCPDVESAKQAASYLGVTLPAIGERPINFHFGKSLRVECDRVGKESPPGWGFKGRRLVREFNIDAPEDEGVDHLGRHLVSTRNEDAGWEVCRADGSFGAESKDSFRDILSTELGASKVTSALAWCIKNPFTIVNEPLQPPTLPGRRINRGRQLNPATYGGNYEHFDMILHHVGRNLDKLVKADDWCIEHGVTTGADYLRLWLAKKVQDPKHPLPYLFIWSEEQDTGKSSLPRAAGMLFEGGETDVYQALVEQFNQQMAGALIGVIEERTLPPAAYAKLKAWVDAPTIAIRAMRENQYTLPNFTAFIHTSNNRDACPLESGDQRIVVIRVSPLVNPLPWREVMEPALRREASDFLGSLLSIKLPPAAGRLFLPVLATDDKLEMMKVDSKALVGKLVDRLEDIEFWSGTAAELLSVLTKWSEREREQGRESIAWPTDPAVLGRLLSSAEPRLAAECLITIDRKSRRANERILKLLPWWCLP